jgi:hypothetical protein
VTLPNTPVSSRSSRSSTPPTGNPQPAAAAKRTRHGASTARPGSAAPATSAGSPSGRKGKFNAGGEHVNGIWQASEAQAERYRQLLELEVAGTIGNLRTEVPFQLTVNNTIICVYRCDFCYDVLNGFGEPTRAIVEDVKGMQTPEFKLKRKLFDATQAVPLSILEVKGKARHPLRPKLSDKTGKPVGSTAGWMDLHWKGRLPD